MGVHEQLASAMGMRAQLPWSVQRGMALRATLLSLPLMQVAASPAPLPLRLPVETDGRYRLRVTPRRAANSHRALSVHGSWMTLPSGFT